MAKKKNQGFYVEHVTWTDAACGGTRWTSPDDAKSFASSDCIIQSVGMVIQDDKVAVTMAYSSDEDWGVAGLLRVPKVCILKRRRLGWVTVKKGA